MIVHAVIALALLASGCSESTSPLPETGRPGLQLTGIFDGRQVVVTDGNPNFVVDECDPNDGLDDDICAIARDIHGELFVLVFENPALLVAGVTVPVTGDCGSPSACDAWREGAVIDVQVATGRRVRASGGEIRVTSMEAGRRHLAGEVRLVFDAASGSAVNGRLSGSFDLVPRPD